MKPAISIDKLSKLYRINLQNGSIGQNDLRETITNWFKTPFHRLRHGASHAMHTEEFWALKDVSFDVYPGEVLGVIGRNGAGKSTLLKILSRITDPTSGTARIRGRVGSLLEVGTGFHPELTGRENVYLNGAILGMTRSEIKRQFDAIADFAGIDKFLDTPVKRYSSGMRVRLGFAVAAHLQPEILIVDEVLAVGDVEFQRKCMGKMNDVADGGRTVMFVSHNMQAISTLARRCVFLENGSVSYIGDTETAITQYIAANGTTDYVYLGTPDDKEPRVTKVEVITSEPNNIHRQGEPLEVKVEIDAPRGVREGRLSIEIVDRRNKPIVKAWVFDTQRPLLRSPGKYRLTCRFPHPRMYMGNYSLVVHLAQALHLPKFQTLENVCPFEIVMHGKHLDYGWRKDMCAYLEDFAWDTTCL